MGFYHWLYEWWTGFVVMAGGALFIWLSLLLLGEYRRAFMASPMSVMSLDVLLSILRCGTPGAWALIGLIAGALFLAGGFVLLVGLLFSSLVDLWQAARLTLGV
jgi:hypothetical protein